MAIAKSLHIMIVDDAPSMRRTIQDILRVAGLTSTAHAENGKEAWKKLHESETPFELMILDWDMPVMNGVELLDQIRNADERFRDIKVLMLTAHATKEDVMEAISLGADNYVVKPFTPETLWKKIETVMGDTLNM